MSFKSETQKESRQESSYSGSDKDISSESTTATDREPQSETRYQFKVHTFGCKVNTYDSGLLEQRMTQRINQRINQEPNQGINQSLRELATARTQPLVHILNSCAVTAEATREAMRLARRLKARDPFTTVVMTGCAAQVDGAILDQAPGIDLVVANSHKGNLENILDRWFRGERDSKVFRSNIFRKEDLEAGGGVEAGHTRAFLKIQDGCNSFCSFCVIPYARGKSRSIGMNDLVKRIRELHRAGVYEVVLTGVHIGDYQDETAASGDLADLVAMVLEKTEIPRVRLTSLEPIELNERLLALFENPRMCRHFHMSIQAADSKVLREMKRKYGQAEVLSALEMIQASVPGAFVGMDVIAGFPGETDQEFNETLNALEKSPWTRLHVFPYSERPGTRAALLEPVPQSIRSERAARLRELSAERFARVALAQVGKTKDVLVLKKSKVRNGIVQGLSRDYWPVQLSDELADDRGSEVAVRIVGYDHSDRHRMDGCLVGEIV